MENTIIASKESNTLSIDRLFNLLKKIIIFKRLFHQLNIAIQHKKLIYTLFLFDTHSRAFIPIAFYRICMSSIKKPKDLIGKKLNLTKNGHPMLNGFKTIIKQQINNNRFQYEFKRTLNIKANMNNLVYYVIMKLHTSKWAKQSKAIRYRACDISKDRINIKKMINVIAGYFLIRKTGYSKPFIKSLKRIVINDNIITFANVLKQLEIKSES